MKTAMMATLFGAVVLSALPVAAQDEAADNLMMNARPVTLQGRRSGEAYFSHDGRFLIFQSERDPANPFYQIFTLDLEEGEIVQVSPGTGKTTCSFFAPNGKRVLYASTHLDPDAKKKQTEELEFRASGKERRYSWDYDENFDIFSDARDGGDAKRLTKSAGYDAEGAYSPDGSKIVFCSLRDAYRGKLSAEDQERLKIDPSYFGEIYIMNADGSSPKRLTDSPGYDGGPFFSPNGERVIWRHFDESGMLADIYTMRTDGSDRRRLTDFASMCWAPYYHPSGQYVVFTTNKHGFANFELYLVDTDGRKEPVRVTDADGFDGLPVFAPDGNRLAWTSNRTASGESQIFMADWNHASALAAVESAPLRGGGSDTFGSEVRADDMRAVVGYLASDELEGRMTGTPGAAKAAAYIIERLQAAGVEPAGENGTYFHEFPFTAGVELMEQGNELLVSQAGTDTRYSVEQDFRPLAFSENREAEGGVVFVGYGMKAPGEAGEGYDSYAGIDATGKIALVLRYVPDDVEMERRQELNRYAGLRYKALAAREAGAIALLVVSGPRSHDAGELVPLKFDQSLANSGIVVASISGAVAEALFAGSGQTLEAVQTELDQENPHFEGSFELPNTSVKISAAVSRKQASGRNVIGVIPPNGDADEAEYVVVGAHYDHLGYGEVGSLAGKGEEGQIHNGADDNASGTAGVLELAAWLGDLRARDPQRFKRGVIIGLWSGEELGIIGSSHYVSKPGVPLDHMVAYFNFDMIGRLRDNKLTVQGTGSSDAWMPMIEKRNVAAGFNLAIQEDPYLPTDLTSFYPKGVPGFSFFTGSHEDYHRPTDDAETLDYSGMERITVFAGRMIVDVVERDEAPQYVKVEPSKSQSGGRGGLKAYLGTIPDYAGEGADGVKLSGVRAGGPADKAGVQGGDIIVELAGQAIKNIYDYTYALDAVKIGEAVKMVLVRGAERVEVTIVPEARK